MPRGEVVPDWVDETPENWYELSCYRESSSEQDIELTRQEFIKLKRYLARLRGYTQSDKEKPELELTLTTAAR